jgi:hypothetical protein
MYAGLTEMQHARILHACTSCGHSDFQTDGVRWIILEQIVGWRSLLL